MVLLMTRFGRRSSKRWWWLLVGALVVVVTVRVDGQQIFRTQASLVPVDVRAVDRHGRPVTDLTIADFTILEDGVPQPIQHMTTQVFKGVEDLRPGGPARPVRTTRFQYTLGYYPANAMVDGRYRRIDVHVNRSGVTLMYRQGYYAQPQPPSFDRGDLRAYTRMVRAFADRAGTTVVRRVSHRPASR